MSKLHKVSFPLDLCIVDWFYFTVLLKEGLKAKFVPYSLTKYRQHASNMIGISFYTLAVFKKLLELKIKHYSYFVGDPVFDSLYEEMLRIDELLDEQKQALIDNNEKVTPYPLWWQNIRL